MTETITIKDYMGNLETRSRADALMARFGIDSKRCDEIQISNDGHLVAFHVRTDRSWHWVRKFVTDD